MLGQSIWFTAFAAPTILIGGFVATRKRLAFHWRDELMDRDNDVYPSLAENDHSNFAYVQPAIVESDFVSNKSLPIHPIHRKGQEVPVEGNTGLYVVPLLSDEEVNLLLDDAISWAGEWGTPTDHRLVAAFQKSCNDAIDEEMDNLFDGNESDRQAVRSGRLSSQSDAVASMLLSTTHRIEQDRGAFLGEVRNISDHAIDFQQMKAPWGTGDAICLEKMPLSLRQLIHRVSSALPGVGRVRHVQVQVSAKGEHYIPPTCPKAFDGHEYVVIPLRRQSLLPSAETATKVEKMGSVVTTSPALRSRITSLREVLANSWTSRDIDVLIPNGSLLRVVGEARYQWGWGMRPASWFGHCSNHVERSRLLSFAECHWLQSHQPSLTNKVLETSSAKFNSEEASAILTLHFEGPRKKGTKRSLIFHPEYFIFGTPPEASTFEAWTDDKPTEQAVADEWVIGFMVKNYFNMLRNS